jgi:hypothetical protein
VHRHPLTEQTGPNYAAAVCQHVASLRPNAFSPGRVHRQLLACAALVSSVLLPFIDHCIQFGPASSVGAVPVQINKRRERNSIESSDLSRFCETSLHQGILWKTRQVRIELNSDHREGSDAIGPNAIRGRLRELENISVLVQIKDKNWTKYILRNVAAVVIEHFERISSVFSPVRRREEVSDQKLKYFCLFSEQ